MSYGCLINVRFGTSFNVCVMDILGISIFGHGTDIPCHMSHGCLMNVCFGTSFNGCLMDILGSLYKVN